MASYESSGSLTTVEKSFSSPQKPDLTGLVYTLNSQSITVDVVGSTGTASEERVSVTLDGATQYELSWSNSHTDFRLEYSLSTSDTSQTPTVDDTSVEVLAVTATPDGPATASGGPGGDAGATASGTASASPDGPASVSSGPGGDAGATGSGTASATPDGATSASAVTMDAGATATGTAAASPSGPATAKAVVSDAGATATGTATATPDGPATAGGGPGGDARATNLVYGTTVLPDAQAPTLGNGVEDEVSVSIPDDTNYGDYRVQIRETGQSAWDSSATGYAENIVASDSDTSGDVTTTFTGREDGEEYEVRVRTETEHVTGAWTSPVSIVTQFPGAVSPSVTGTTTTSVSLEGTDQADNEDGILILRQQKYGGSWGNWKEIDDIGPFSGTGTFTYTDSTPRPGREYRYKFRAYTEDAEADSTTVTATTDSLGLHRRSINSKGWDVEVERPDGRVFKPTIIGDPEWIPRTNDLPKVRIPVQRSERWMEKEYENQPMRVWKDGSLLSIDKIEVADRREDKVVIEGRGGLELLGRTRVSYQNKAVHTAAKEIIQSDTSYIANVDAPDTSKTEDSLLESTDSQSEWENTIPATPFSSTDPRKIENGSIKTDPCALYAEANDMSDLTGGGGSPFYADRFSQGDSVELFAIGTGKKVSFTNGYDYPSSDAKFGFRFEYNDGTHPGFDIIVDGTTELSISADEDFVGSSPTWLDLSLSSGLPAGDHTFKFEITEAASDDSPIFLDAVALFDARHTSVADETLTNGGKLSYPKVHPSSVQFETDDVATVKQVTAGRLEATVNSTSNNQALAISNDQGVNWITASNTSTVEGNFSSDTSQIRARFTLSYYDTGGGDLKYDGGQEVDLYDLYADLVDTPTLDDTSKDDTTLNVLQSFADYGNFVFEVRETSNGTAIEWTQPGQRTDTLDSSIGEYSVEKNTERAYEKVVVKGAALNRRGEEFTSNHGTWVSISETDLINGAEVVYDPNDGTQYERGSDYQINYLEGEIKVLSSGAMSDATTYETSYRHRVIGEYAIPGAGSDPKILTEIIPTLSTVQSCDQAAFYLSKKVQDPRHTARIVVDEISPNQSIVDSLSLPDEVQAGVSGTFVPEEIENKTSQSIVKLGSRETVGELVADIKRRLSGVTEQV
jgi:hypothetical protein